MEEATWGLFSQLNVLPTFMDAFFVGRLYLPSGGIAILPRLAGPSCIKCATVVQGLNFGDIFG